MVVSFDEAIKMLKDFRRTWSFLGWPRREVIHTYVTLNEADFKALVAGDVVTKGDYVEVKIILSDIGFDVIREVVRSQPPR